MKRKCPKCKESKEIDDFYPSRLYICKSCLSKQNKKEYLLEKEFVSCSKVNFTLFGISLASYNIIISLFLLILSLLKLKKNYI